MTVATKPEVIEQIRYEWAISPGVSLRQIAKRFQADYSSALVKDRRITEIIVEAQQEAPVHPFPLTPWRPEADGDESLEESLFVLQLHHLKKLEGGAGLLRHEAVWARRLQKTLEGLKPHQQLEVVMTYSKRERAAYHLNQELYTEDWDTFLAHQPWRSAEHQRRYEEVIARGVAPIPSLGASERFLRALIEQGPDKVGERVWGRLSWHPLFRLLMEGDLEPGWSSTVLAWLDDPQDQLPVMKSPTSVKEPVTQA